MVKGKLNLERVQNRQDNIHRLAENRIIAEKCFQIDALDSSAYWRASREKRRELRAVAHSLPLEAFGFEELVELKE